MSLEERPQDLNTNEVTVPIEKIIEAVKTGSEVLFTHDTDRQDVGNSIAVDEEGGLDSGPNDNEPQTGLGRAVVEYLFTPTEVIDMSLIRPDNAPTQSLYFDDFPTEILPIAADDVRGVDTDAFSVSELLAAGTEDLNDPRWDRFAPDELYKELVTDRRHATVPTLGQAVIPEAVGSAETFEPIAAAAPIHLNETDESFDDASTVPDALWALYADDEAFMSLVSEWNGKATDLQMEIGKLRELRDTSPSKQRHDEASAFAAEMTKRLEAGEEVPGDWIRTVDRMHADARRLDTYDKPLAHLRSQVMAL
jgi:hypothetical protein